MSNRGRAAAAVVLAASLAGACGGTALVSNAPATVAPSAVVTPNPHLSEPASVDDVIRKLVIGGLRITANTASSGASGEPVKRVNATYASWPLVITQFSSSAALREVGEFDVAVPPRFGESPYVIAGLNVMIEFGPHSTNDETPAAPGAEHQAAALALVLALHPLLGPLEQRATQPLALPGVAAQLPSALPAGTAAP